MNGRGTMDIEATIDDSIKPELIEALGRQVANSVLTQATLAYVSTDGTDSGRIRAFVDAIRSDEQVMGAWGEEALADLVQAWIGRLGPAAGSEDEEEAVTARILDGRAMAKDVRQEVIDDAMAFEAEYGFAPTIAVVRAGSDPASVSYAKMIKRSFENAGMNFVLHTLPGSASQEEIIDLVHMLNADSSVSGIMVQEPLPRRIDDIAIKSAIAPEKDADGVNPINAGRLAQAAPVGRSSGVKDYMVPATPLGGLEILKRAGIEMDGARAVVVGRSNIVGRPMTFLLMQHHATVSMCHSHTRPLGGVTREADILCVAVGVAELIKADMVKPGAVVIDFGFNRKGDKWVGDVDFEAVKMVAGAITPVPGGTGSMTNVMLMRNVVEAARRRMAERGR
jgi:methylenetetrahydrofolate dehydrogenase (NADP+)/methenyltetrahydrofolate cyclohydrolase